MLILITLVFMCLIVISLFKKLKGLSPLGKALLFFYVNILLREEIAVIERNFGLLEREMSLSKWITMIIFGTTWNPIVISLGTLFIWKSHSNKTKFFFLLGGLVLFLTGMETIWSWLGYIHYVHWNSFYTAIRYTLTILLAFIFLKWLDKKVIKI